MADIQKLITELCPDGVEFKKLGEIGTFVRGNGLQKKDFTERGVGCIHYGQIYTYYNLFTTETKSFVDPDLAKKLTKVEPGNLIIACTSENMEDVCKAVAWIGEVDIVTGGHACVFKHNENPKYISYFFQTEDFNIQKKKYARGAKVIDIKASDLANIVIPVPPLAVQSEIVKILDNFTELTAELTEKLTAELTARKKQYEYYRDNLLTFGDDVPVFALSDIAQYSKDRIDADCVDADNYIGVDNLLQQKRGKVQSSCVPTSGRLTKYHKNDILIGNIRPYLRKIWFANNDGGTNGDVLTIQTISDKVNPRYLFVQLSSEAFFNYDTQNSKGAKMPRGDKAAVMRYPIPIPSLEEQQRIVDILDRFDTLCNDISNGLPAAIEARQKQYEYYRNQLLTFE